MQQNSPQQRQLHVAQPADDVMSSTSSPRAFIPSAGFPAIAEGDLTSSSQSVVEHGQVSGSAPANHFVAADAFDQQNRIYRDENRVEPAPLLDNRSLSDLHLSKVGTFAKKSLLHDLIRVAELTPGEREQVKKNKLRQHGVIEVLKFWKVKEQGRTVSDLIQLLDRAGSPDNKYQNVIDNLRSTLP